MSIPAFSLRRIALPVFGPSLLFGLGKGAILPVVPLTVRELGGSVALAALVVTLLGIGSLAGSLPASALTARFGERRAFVGGAVLAAAAMLLCVFADAIHGFAAGIFLVGAAGAVFNLARLSYLTVVVPLHFRARALSTLGGVMRIGLFAGPFAGAALVHLYGLEGAYWAGACVMAIAAAVALGMPDLPDEAWPATHDAASVATPDAAPTLRSVALAHRRVFATVGLGVALIGAVRSARQAIIPLWAEHIGLDAAMASVVYGLAGAVDMLVFYPAGKRMDTRGRRSVAVPCMAIMGAALLLMPFTSTMSALLIVSLLLGFGNGIGSGIVMTLGADHSPVRGRAQFFGVWRLVSDLGATAGPVLLSAMAAVATLAAGIAATGLLALLGGVLLWRWIPPPGPSNVPDSRPPTDR